LSIAALTNKWLNKLYKSIAIVLVIFAVFISSLRLFLPYAEHYRVDFQRYVNNTYGTHIEIGSLSMDWQKHGPVLVANNVSLLETESVAVFIKNIDIKINFWRTLQHRTLVTHDLTLNGAKVFIDRAELASNTISPQELDLYDQLSDVFLLQVNKFSLDSSQLIVRTDKGDRKINIEHLNWLNKGERHRASGNIVAHGLSTNSVKLLVDMRGTEFSNMSGQFYLQADKVNVTPWLDKVFVLADEKTYSEVNFESWLTIENGQAKHFQLGVDDTKIRWLVEDKEHEFLIKSGAISADVLANGIRVRSSPFEVSIDQDIWQPIHINADITEDVFDLYVSSLEVNGLSKLVPLMVKSSDVSSTVSQLNPKGDISDIHLHISHGQIAATADIVNYQQHYSKGIPALTNLSAALVVKDNTLVADVQVKDSSLDFDNNFKQHIPFTKITSMLHLSWQDKGITVKANDIKFTSKALTAAADVEVNIPSNTDASMALLANIEQGDATFANYFYPHQLMGNDLVNYLDESIIEGQTTRGQVLFNGAFNDFPFYDNQGVFIVDADLDNAKFKFDPQWPVIHNLKANLTFTNNSMLITAKEGSLQGLNVKGVTAAIDDLSNEQILVVKAHVDQVSSKNVNQLMKHSPLAGSVGATLDILQVSAPVSGYFQLDLPLNNIDNVLASGYVDFVDNKVLLTTPEMVFTQVNGRLSYQNDVIEANQIALNWRDMPVTVDVKARDEQDAYITNLALSANWAEQLWLAQVPQSMRHYSHGEINWQGDVALHVHHNGGFSYQANVNSDLLNTALLLPQPYTLEANEKMALVADIEGQSETSTISINAGEQLNFFGVMNHEKVQFQRAHLVLGNDTMLLPMDGFHITTKLANADIHQWQPLIQDILENLPNEEQLTTQHSLFTAPERIRGNIGSLSLLGQSISNVSFNLLDQEDWWLLRFNAKEARSEIKFFPNWTEQGIEVDADFIHLQARQPEFEVEAAKPFDYKESLAIFNSIPKVALSCDSCKVNQLDLGELSFTLDREQDRILLNNFKASRNKANASFDASWQLTPEYSLTSVKGNLEVKDLEHEFENFNFGSIIKDSGMEAEYDINWQGGPQDFALSGLNGKLKLDIDDGYLADVSDKGARIFSVLSLQSLVRKLTLDFRDIFSDGMFYDHIRADAQLKDGVLYTDNTRMKGAAGDLVMKGNTNLAEGILDYRMSYKPNLTSSLPVLAWIATLEPVTFLAGVAIDQVFNAKVVSEFNFELTGNLTDPQLKEVNRKSRDVSVGRSTPPKFVENNSEQVDDKPKNKNLTPPLPIDLGDKNDG